MGPLDGALVVCRGGFCRRNISSAFGKPVLAGILIADERLGGDRDLFLDRLGNDRSDRHCIFAHVCDGPVQRNRILATACALDRS